MFHRQSRAWHVACAGSLAKSDIAVRLAKCQCLLESANVCFGAEALLWYGVLLVLLEDRLPCHEKVGQTVVQLLQETVVDHFHHVVHVEGYRFCGCIGRSESVFPGSTGNKWYSRLLCFCVEHNLVLSIAHLLE